MDQPVWIGIQFELLHIVYRGISVVNICVFGSVSIPGGWAQIENAAPSGMPRSLFLGGYDLLTLAKPAIPAKIATTCVFELSMTLRADTDHG